MIDVTSLTFLLKYFITAYDNYILDNQTIYAYYHVWMADNDMVYRFYSMD
jgi:hypothetical protein